MAQSRLLTQQRVIALPPFKLKEMRDNPRLPYNVRRAAANLLAAKEVDGVRQNYLR